MKKIINLSVCFCLIIVSCIFAFANNNVVIGRGFGKNKKIETATEFKELLNSLYLQSTNKSLCDDYKPISIHAINNEQIQNSENFSVSKINSATIELKDNSYVYSSDDDISTTLKMNRSMTVVIKENETYYHIVGSMHVYVSINNSNFRKNYKNSEGTVDVSFDMEMYFAEDKALMKFNVFEVISSDKLKVNNDSLGKWFDVTNNDTYIFGENQQTFSAINDSNLDFFKCVGNLLNNENNFEIDGHEYNLKEECEKYFLMDILDLNETELSALRDVKANVNFNLSNTSTPRIFFSYDVNGVGFSCNQTSSAIIKNINNSTIKFPSAKIYDYEDLF